MTTVPWSDTKVHVFKSTAPQASWCEDCKEGRRWVVAIDGALYHFSTWDKAMTFVRWELTDESG